jgi:hypothetical protein
MSAIEYGSYYGCVVLNENAGHEQESVLLHADDLAIDSNGTLTFRSAGRRPAGAELNGHNGNQEIQGKNSSDEKDEKGGKEGHKDKKMIYVAFAPGTWKVVYAAKLQDGTPASVEHWNRDGKSEAPSVVPPNSGAAGVPYRG